MEPLFDLGGWGPVPEELLKLHPKVSASGLVELSKGPAYFESRYLLKEGKETDAMRLGTAVHMGILEPEKFAQTYIQDPGKPPEGILSTADQMKDFLKKLELKISGSKAELMDRIRNCGVEAEFEDEWFKKMTEGKEPLSKDDMHAINRLRARIDEMPVLKSMISGGEPEKLGWVRHRRTGLIISFKADYIKMFRQAVDINGSMIDGVVTDVKKVRAGKADPKKFGWTVQDMMMHVQAAIYVDAMAALYSKRMAFLWMPVEDKAPFVVKGLTAPEALIDAGRGQYELAINKYFKCLEANRWPLEGLELEDVDMSSWFWEQQKNFDDDQEEVQE